MLRRISYYATHAALCVSVSLAIGAMLGLEPEYSAYVSAVLFVTLMLCSGNPVPVDHAEVKRRAADAQNNQCNSQATSSLSDVDGGGD